MRCEYTEFATSQELHNNDNKDIHIVCSFIDATKLWGGEGEGVHFSQLNYKCIRIISRNMLIL